MSIFYGSCCINERRTISGSANARSIELAHLDWMNWFHIDASVSGLVSVTPFSRNQRVLPSNVLGVDAEAVASHI